MDNLCRPSTSIGVARPHADGYDPRYPVAVAVRMPLCLNQTPASRLVDAQGQPYFVWDQPMTLSEFVRGLESHDKAIRAGFVARLMRDARPDDVFQFLDRAQIVAVWPDVAPQLGRQRAFWTWLLGDRWGWIDDRLDDAE